MSQIIDHILSTQISDSDGLNELNTLATLRVGLATLANQVYRWELVLRKQEDDNHADLSCWVNLGLPANQQEMLSCIFHWFGVSLCNYVRLTGFLVGIAEGVYERSAIENSSNYVAITSFCLEYFERFPELAPVKLWRDKVFAHFAITSPRKVDNAAMLDWSTMEPLAFFDHRFRVGGMNIMTRGSEASLPQWSVTEIFELLTSRYWPEFALVKPA